MTWGRDLGMMACQNRLQEFNPVPFDGTDFGIGRPPPSPRPAPSDRMFSTLFLVVAIGALVMPISVAAFVDLVRFVLGR